MKKTFFFICVIVISLCILAGKFLPANSRAVYAEDLNHNKIECSNASDAELMGIFTALSLSIKVENGQIVATSKNKITLFPSKVKVYVQLYSSLTREESYHTMTLESENYTADLNMGKTISTYAAINGVKRYWQARIYYKADDANWKEKMTNIWLVDIDGTAQEY